MRTRLRRARRNALPRSNHRSVAQLEAHPTLNRGGEGSIPSGPTAASSDAATATCARLSDARTRALHARRPLLRARLAAGHWSLNPGRQVRILCPEPAALSRGPSLYDNLAPKARRVTCALTASSSRLERDRARRDGSSTHGRDERTFQRSRMVRQPAVNRSFEGSIPSAGAPSSARRVHTRKTMLVRLQRGPPAARHGPLAKW